MKFLGPINALFLANFTKLKDWIKGKLNCYFSNRNLEQIDLIRIYQPEIALKDIGICNVRPWRDICNVRPWRDMLNNNMQPTACKVILCKSEQGFTNTEQIQHAFLLRIVLEDHN